jgi:hypothetical protein
LGEGMRIFQWTFSQAAPQVGQVTDSTFWDRR